MNALKSSVTIHDVARQLKVSATTVWRALNDRPRVSAATKQRVLRAVERLGYQPSLLAQNLSRGRTQTLGVVVPMIGNPVYAALVRAVEQAAFERDYNIILCDTDFQAERERRYLDLLRRRKVEGILLIPFAQRNDEEVVPIAELRAAGIAVVAMQQPLAGGNAPQVAPDNLQAARAMTQHLIGLGHRRIALIHSGLERWHPSMCERFAGYRLALKQAGIPYDPSLVVKAGTFETVLADGSSAFDAAAVAALLRRPDRPTAIFAPVDVLAIRVLGVIRSLGLRIPEDVALAGFDDILMSAHLEPPLTTVRHPTAQVGRRAAELLFEILENGQAATEETIERVPCELVIRRSCGSREPVASVGA
jgi:DNA-binding LacI/PurR family transcriptional regulator